MEAQTRARERELAEAQAREGFGQSIAGLLEELKAGGDAVQLSSKLEELAKQAAGSGLPAGQQSAMQGDGGQTAQQKRQGGQQAPPPKKVKEGGKEESRG
eukprot:3975973-Lingulodinium_polyedra.AAC.1